MFSHQKECLKHVLKVLKAVDKGAHIPEEIWEPFWGLLFQIAELVDTFRTPPEVSPKEAVFLINTRNQLLTTRNIDAVVSRISERLNTE